MRNSAGLPQGTVKFKPVRLGGVGFVTKFCISNDAVTQVCGTDVFGAYVKSSAVGDKIWRPAFTSATLATGDCPGTSGYVAPAAGLVDFKGIFEIVVAPSSNSTIYAVWNARVWKSTNSGQSWVHQTGVPDIKAETNNGPQPHNNGPSMAVDPQNPAVVLIGTQNNGLYYTTNGGTTWTNVALGTNGTARGWQVPSKVACDPTSTVTSTIKQRWFAVRQGTGVYVSTTGPGGTYTLMTGSPTYVADIVFDASGNCWAVDPTNTAGTTSNLWKCAAGGTTWAQGPGSAPVAHFGVSVACDPLTSGASGRVVVMSDGGTAIVSSNGGTSWLGADVFNKNYPAQPTISTNAYTIPWLGSGPASTFNAGMARFDPVTSNKLWCSAGVGVLSCQPPTVFSTATPANVASQFNWIEATEGIECADANNMIEPTGGAPVFAIWDQGAWRMADLDHSWRGFANRAPPGAFASTVQACWDVDVASDDPTYIVALINFSGEWSSYSTDGWQTIHKFATTPPYDLIGGCVCCGPKNNILINQTGGDNGAWAAPYYTKDGGTTWAPINAPGVTASFVGHIDNGSGATGTTVTVTAMNFGSIVTGMAICPGNGTGSLGNITGQVTGTAGGIGTYTLSVSKLVASQTLTATAGGFGASADYVHRKNAAYDPQTGKYYLTNYGTQDGPVSFTSNAGIWTATDLAGTWTKVYSGQLWSYSNDFWNTRLKKVPGQSGHFFVCTDTANVSLLRTTNGFTTAPTAVTNVTQVTDIVFGPAAPGQSYPSIWFYGFVSGVLGLYRSDDNFATTPKLVTTFPANTCDTVVVLGGSPNKYGRLYAGLQGSGWLYGDYDSPITLS